MRDLYCTIGVVGWILGIFGTDVGLGYLGVALQCEEEPTPVRCAEATEHAPDRIGYVTLTDFEPLLDAATYVSYNEGKTYSARVPLVPRSAERRGASVRVVAAISGIRTPDEVAAAFAGGELTGMLLEPGITGQSAELQSTCPGISTEFCRQLNTGDRPHSIAFGAGMALAAMIGFGGGFVMLVHGLFGIQDPRPLNGVLVMVPLVLIVQGAGWVCQRLIPREFAAPLAVATGVFLFGTGAMQLHEHGLASLSPYERAPGSTLLVNLGLALLLLGGYFVCRKEPAVDDSLLQSETESSPVVAG